MLLECPRVPMLPPLPLLREFLGLSHLEIEPAGVTGMTLREVSDLLPDEIDLIVYA